MKADETANRNGATNKHAQQQQEQLAHRRCGEPLALAIEERISADQKRALPQLVQGCEDLVEVSFNARVHDMKLQSMSALLADAGAVLCFMVTQWIMRNAKEKSEVDDKALRIVRVTLRSFAQSRKKLLERFLCCLETQAAKGVHGTDRGNRFSR